MKKLLLLLLLLTSTAALGWDKNERYASYGNTRCSDYIRTRAERGAEDPEWVTTYYAWVAGYITAFNRHARDTYNILGKNDVESVLFWLDKWCKANPLESLSIGMEDLVEELYPRRRRSK